MTARKPAHRAPRIRPYPARHRKPNRRPQVTVYNPPTPAELEVIAFLAANRWPFGI